MTPPAPLLDATDLSCRIENRTLWQGLDLSLRAGDSLAITGPSGSGKTLLLRTLVGLNPWGRAHLQWRGRSVGLATLTAFRADVIYLSQRPALPEGTVQNALEAPFRLRVHRGKTLSKTDTQTYLQAVDLTKAFLTQDTMSLSGGEAQLVSLLRAMLLQPSVLLLDEPTASLDSSRVRQIEALLRHWLQAGPERAFACVSHDIDQVGRLCNRHFSLGAATEMSTTTGTAAS